MNQFQTKSHNFNPDFMLPILCFTKWCLTVNHVWSVSMFHCVNPNWQELWQQETCSSLVPSSQIFWWDPMSLAGCQINPIDVNFHLQKKCGFFDENSDSKIQSKKNKGIKVSTLMPFWSPMNSHRVYGLFLLFCLTTLKVIRLSFWSLAGCQINPIDVNFHLQKSVAYWMKIQLAKSNPRRTRG